MIYLDHNATTPLGAQAEAAMRDALAVWGNPSSVHAPGRQARHLVERGRARVAALLGCGPDEIVFTSGGSEGNNLAIRGLALSEWARRKTAPAGRPPHVVSSPLEHPSVTGSLSELRREGFDVTLLPADRYGFIAAADLRAAVRPETVLVTLALANHEIGNVYPVREWAAIARAAGARFHTDAVQAVGRIPVDVGGPSADALGVDAATVSAHKLHGPKGIGAVFVRRGVAVHPLVVGGHQEYERRGGTENVIGISGFSAACDVSLEELKRDRMTATAELRDRLAASLMAIPGARLQGGLAAPAAEPAGGESACTRVTPGTLNIGFDGARGDLVAIGLDLEGVCVSTGAACTSGSVEPSPTILALGLPPALAREAVRFSLGRETSLADIDRAATLTRVVVERVRAAYGGAPGSRV